MKNIKQVAVHDLELLEHPEYLNEFPIIIYGAGKRGRKVLSVLRDIEVYPTAFCDIAAEQMDRKVNDIDVITVNEIKKEKKELLVVIAIEDVKIADEVLLELQDCINLKLVTYFALEKCAFFQGEKRRLNTKIEITLNWIKRWYFEQIERVDYLLDALNSTLIIYQNGKVGSSTIYHSLLAAGVNCAHLHRIRFEKDMEQFMLCDELDYDGLASKISFKNNKKLIEDVLTQMKSKKLKIISLVRDPVAVDISMVFQWFGTEMLDYYLFRSDTGFKESILQLILKKKNRLFEWFDEELKEVFGIDIYKYPFDKERGYVKINQGNIEVLVLQTEKINDLQSVIGDFIGKKGFQIVNFNESNKKEYRYIYKKFLEEVKLPEEYINFYYCGNKSMNHFYSDEDQKRFYDRWRRLQ